MLTATEAFETFESMDYLPLGILVLDADCRVRFWNACLESWSGMDRCAILGRDIRSIFPNLDQPLVLDRIRSLFEGGPPAVFSYHLHKYLIPCPLPSGRMRLQHSVAAGLQDASGSVRYVVISMQDVTEIHTRLQDNLSILNQLNQEIDRRTRVEARLREMATVDSLTGVLNRRAFMEALGHEFLRAKRHRHPLSLLMLDLDHFKNINDMWGHLIGDKVLAAFADLCAVEIRQSDVFGRVGGEEFAIILPETALDMALHVGRRIRHSISETPIPIEDNDISLSVSLGVATLEEGEDVEGLLREADLSLYEAKRLGRDMVVARGTVYK